MTSLKTLFPIPSQNLGASQTIPSTKLLNIPPTRFKLASFSFTKNSAIKAQHLEARSRVSYPPTVWGDSFRFSSFNQSDYDSYTKQIQVPKEAVKERLMPALNGPMEKIYFIDLLSRLGVSYHFEDQIKKQLDENFDAIANEVASRDCDLYSVALVFRILRQNRYKISCDVFNKFKGSDGKFKQSLTTDVKGMLSLYEAAYLGIHGEDILDEAIAFTRPFLESYVEKSSSSSNAFVKHISNALIFPFHRGMPRLEARQYISFYEEDEFRDEILLNFAKLDFNRLQLLYQQELKHISKWASDLDFTSKFPFAKDRTVELYLWTMGLAFEPKYARSREFLTKILKLVSVVDDLFDEYGTLDELQSFTDGLKRWSIDGLNQVPEYMKVLYKAILDLFNEFKNEVEEEGRSYIVKDEVINLVQAYMVQAERSHDGSVPSLDEYMEAGYYTSCSPLAIAGFYAGMPEVKGTKTFEWLSTEPKILEASSVIVRVVDDIAIDKHEEEISSVECYMKHYGVTKEEATKELRQRVERAWKDTNEEFMRLNNFPISLLMPFVNIARGADVFCKYVDAYTNPEHLKDHVESVFIKPITIH